MSAWNGQSRCLFMKCHLRQLAGLSLSRSHQAGPQPRDTHWKHTAKQLYVKSWKDPMSSNCPPPSLGGGLPFSLYLSPEQNLGGEVVKD